MIPALSEPSEGPARCRWDSLLAPFPRHFEPCSKALSYLRLSVLTKAQASRAQSRFASEKLMQKTQIIINQY